MGKINPGRNGSKKDVITKKAALLFIEKGFSATSMRDIAEGVGIEAPSLYNHITGKNELLEEICSRIARAESAPQDTARWLLRGPLPRNRPGHGRVRG